MVWFTLLLKLLGYAIGSVVMYWGFLLLLVAPWLFMLLLVVLSNAVWNNITGQTEEWKWFLKGTEAVIQRIQRLEFEWVGWIPGILIQIWYAGYAAHLVLTSISETSGEGAIVLEGMGIMGMLIAAALFYGLYRFVVEVKLNPWIYLLVGGLALSSYLMLLQYPQVAEVLSGSWQQVFAALFSALLS
jgi:hypothetical protein